MKARSVVFGHIQHPSTAFGLPPLMMGLSLAGATAVLVVMFLVGIFAFSGAIAISMIAFAVTLAAGLWLSYRAGRSDRHVESVFLTTARFWRSSPRRWLLAGAAPERSRGGRS